MGLKLDNVEKIVGAETYLKGINLEFAPGSRNVILGRTLAGKTSLLRIMAGLDRPSKGRIIIDEKDVTGLSVRNALWPWCISCSSTIPL
jgi:glycerol transport system ATP-binding protein